ncbi:MAG: Crp/Fnr family transcriptional regulator [Bauldia sp.]|nr:Crp/Fnr family transcriptional regulator [Bauldia sp.]
MVQVDQFRASPLQILEPLHRIGWLSEQSEDLKLWIAANGRWRTVASGQAVYLSGDDADGLYGIGTGALDIQYVPDGLRSDVWIRAQPGGWLGQEAILPDRPRVFNLIAGADSRVYFVPRRALRLLLQERPDMWPQLYALAILQSRRLMELLYDALLLSPDSRLARLLLRLSVTTPKITATQHDLCALLGMPRSSLRRSLKSLQDAGAISTSYRTIEVVDPVLLKRLSSESAEP